MTRVWYIGLEFLIPVVHNLFRCPNLAVKEAEDDENIIEEDVPLEKAKKVTHAKRKKQTQCNLTWIGESVEVFV